MANVIMANENQKEYLRNLADILELQINEEALEKLNSPQISAKIRQLKPLADKKRAENLKPSDAQKDFLNILLDTLGLTAGDVPENAFTDRRECSNQIEILNIKNYHLQLGIVEDPAPEVISDKTKRKEYLKMLKDMLEASPIEDDVLFTQAQ